MRTKVREYSDQEKIETLSTTIDSDPRDAPKGYFVTIMACTLG
jgi:hypothetical protein